MSTIRIISQKGTLFLKIDDSKCLKIKPGIEKELASLQISEISVEFDHNSKTRQMLLKALKQWNPVCEVFSVEKAVGMLYASKLMKTVRVMKEMRLTTTNESFQTTTLDDVTMESGELRLKVDGKCQGEGLLEKMKDMSFVDIETDPQGAMKILKDLHVSSETPKLKRLTMKVSGRSRLKKFPYTSSPEIPLKPLSKNSCSTFLLHLSSQKVVVISERLMNTNTKGLVVSFIDKKPEEQLQGLIDVLGLKEYIQETEISRFLKGNEDQQLKIIQEAYDRGFDALYNSMEFNVTITAPALGRTWHTKF